MRAAGAALGLVVLAACNRDRADRGAGNGSALLSDASPEAQQALAIPVDYELTEERFAQWEEAQRNLERLPKSALPLADGGGGNVIERAVARLESSPRARTAVEASGLTVMEFVLQTIALAQANDAAQSGRGRGKVQQQNIAFVENFRSRILRAQRERRELEAKDEVWETIEVSPAGSSDAHSNADSVDEAQQREDASSGIPRDPPAQPPIPRAPPRNQIPTSAPVLPPIPTTPTVRDPIPTKPPVRDSLLAGLTG